MVIGMDAKTENLHDRHEPTAKRTAKDSVFRNLFAMPKYRFQLYRALHPEDEDTKEADLEEMTNESHLLNQQYNDLGFLVKDKLIILVEHQSTWTENIVVRVLLYMVQTWFKYIKDHELNIYDKEKITLPAPELYVIYTGAGADRKPDIITLKDSFFGGRDIDIDCKVKVIIDGKQGDIINQYIRFCHVFNEQVKIYGRTKKAVEETIRICQSENVLREYLEKQRKEVIDIMVTLFDEETIQNNYLASERRKSARDTAGLMNYLWSNGRGAEAQKASNDDDLLNRLLAEYQNQRQ